VIAFTSLASRLQDFMPRNGEGSAKKLKLSAKIGLHAHYLPRRLTGTSFLASPVRDCYKNTKKKNLGLTL
jgi:hypothetical protein